MKTEEDEAFDELARKQGDWGGGFPAKRAMAADKLVEDLAVYGTSWSKDGERIDPMSVYLDEPAQEPVAWRRREVGGLWQYFGWEETGMTYQSVERWNKNGFECEAIPAIPATPPQPAEIQRLTAELKKANDQAEHFEREWYLRGDEIERLKAAQHEPYGYYDDKDGMFTKTGFYSNESELIAKGVIFALYTTPPKREWVGLTDEEIDDAAHYCVKCRLGWTRT